MTDFHKPLQQLPFRLFVCLDCLRQTCNSQIELRELLEHYLTELARQFLHCRDYAEWPMVDSDLHTDGHEYVWIDGCFHSGQLNEPAIRGLLERAAPTLLNPSMHFDERRAPSPEAHDALEGKGASDLLYPGVQPSSVKTYQGPKPESDARGLEKLQSRGAIDLGIAYKFYSSGIHHKRQVVAVAESSLPRLMALVHGNLRPALWDIEREVGSATGRGEEDWEAWPAGRQAQEVFAWRVFDAYLRLIGDDELQGRIQSLWPDQVPCLDEALHRLDLPSDRLCLIQGDVAVIQFTVDSRWTGFPSVRTYGDLFKALDALSYPRLGATRDRDLSQAFSKLLRAIAHPLTVVRVSEVDWRPVLSRITFKRSP